MNRLRTRLTYANVMATVAVFIALGGASYAAVTVTGANVKDGSLTSADIKNNTIQGADIRESAINSDDIANGSILAEDLHGGVLAGATGPKGETGAAGPKGDTGPKGDKGDTGAPGAPGSDAQFSGASAGGSLAGTYPNPTIAAGAVSGTNLADGAVNGSKVAADSLTGSNIDESTLGNVPSASSVGGENIVTATGFLNFSINQTSDVTATCPDDRLAVRGVILNSADVTVNSTSYGRSTYTVNATSGSSTGARFVFTQVTCFGGT